MFSEEMEMSMNLKKQHILRVILSWNFDSWWWWRALFNKLINWNEIAKAMEYNSYTF